MLAMSGSVGFGRVAGGAANVEIALRDVRDSDLPVFWAQTSDERAQYMAAVTRGYHYDRAAFDAHWAKVRSDPAVIVRTVLADGEVAGHAAVFGPPDEREVSTLAVTRDLRGRCRTIGIRSHPERRIRHLSPQSQTGPAVSTSSSPHRTAVRQWPTVPGRRATNLVRAHMPAPVPRSRRRPPPISRTDS